MGKEEKIEPTKETFDFVMRDGTVLTFRKLKMKDLLNASSKNQTLKGMEMLALACVAVNGEAKKLNPLQDIAEWEIGDFNNASKALSEFSGIELEETDAKNF